MPSDDLKEHATSSVDYYDLLGINFETSEADIRRAYRRTALKYHPDKNAGKPDVIEKFHLLQIAYDVLSDPTYKSLYDSTRRAKKEKAEREQAFEGKRRKMKEDLERRESGHFKRKRDEDDDEMKLQREIQRLAEDGKRRRKERSEVLARERLEEEERLDREQNGYVGPQSTTPAPQGGLAVPEIDRSVKVTWSKEEGPGQAIDKDTLTRKFATFGNIEASFFLKDKKKRLGDQKSKSIVATGVVVYSSAVGAVAAVEDFKKQSDPFFSLLESVFWASNKEPDFVQPGASTKATSPNVDEMLLIRLKLVGKRRKENALKEAASTPSTPQSILSETPKPSPLSSAKAQLPETPLKTQVPKFSFSPAVSLHSKDTPSAADRNAEKRRLEERIRKEDAEADAQAAESENA